MMSAKRRSKSRDKEEKNMENGLKYGITLYCFAKTFLRELDLEGCVKRARDIGYRGVNIVAAQSCDEYPFPSDDWIKRFRDILDKYEMDPVCWEGYLDMGMRNDRDLSPEEIEEFTRNDIIYANKAGFKMMKSQHSITPEIFEKMLPLCEKMNVKLNLEMHHPHHPEVPVWQEYFKIMEKSGGWLGIAPDMSIFAKYPHELHMRKAVRDGCRAEKVKEIAALKFADKPESAVAELDLNDKEKAYAEEVYFRFNAPARLEQLPFLLKYTHMIHGKFWYIDEKENDACIPYEKIMPIVKQSGYDGYLIAEYEGHAFDVDEVESEQIKRYWRMVKRLYDNA